MVSLPINKIPYDDAWIKNWWLVHRLIYEWLLRLSIKYKMTELPSSITKIVPRSSEYVTVLSCLLNFTDWYTYLE